MSISFTLYDPASLPADFRYPRELHEIAAGRVVASVEPWWFVDAASKAGTLLFSVRNHDGRNLVPFAKMEDDIACFDGDDRSGDPRVVALVLDNSGREYGFANFSAWLAAASPAPATK